MRYPSPLLLVTLCCFLTACGSPAPDAALCDLDYVEISDPTGWVLRLHGDGGGKLWHRELPAHPLHYPARTFDPAAGRDLTRSGCGQARRDPVCTSVTYYEAMVNRKISCRCTGAGWPGDVLRRAITKMPLAVEAGGNPRNCRMLRRRWLAAVE